MNTTTPTQRSARIWAIVATVAFHGVLLWLLLWLCLSYTPGQESERRWPPVDEDEILFGGEYVMVGDDPFNPSLNGEGMPEESVVEETIVEGDDPVDAGVANAAPAPTLASNQPSSVKVNPTPVQKEGPTREEIEAAERERRERETAERVSQRVKFGSTTPSNSGSPKSGSQNGNASSGALSGTPGTDLSGRTLASWAKPTGRSTGTIVIQVTVNRKGTVTQARYISGTGSIAADRAARTSCEQAALKSSFSVAENAPVAQVGRITYRFE